MADDIRIAWGRVFGDLVEQVNTGLLCTALEQEADVDWALALNEKEPDVFNAAVKLRDLVAEAMADPADY